MATSFTLAQGTRSSSVLVMSTLASATYIASSAIDLGATIPEDVVLEVEVTPSTTPSGNKQLKVWVQLSLDNTNYTSGPTSGTTTTDEGDLLPVGTVPVNSTGTHRRMLSLREAGIPITRYMKIVVQNDLGVALTSGNVYRADITGTGT